MLVFVLTVLSLAFLSIWVIPWWIRTYNNFQVFYTKAERQFADVDVVMQQRLDNIQTLAHSVKTYDGHEQQVIRDAIEARTHWSKDIPLNEKIALIPRIEDAYLKLKALAEQYPNLKANEMHLNFMNTESLVETQLRQSRFNYNESAQEYNQRMRTFPSNIVATAHSLPRLKYIAFRAKAVFQPKELIA